MVLVERFQRNGLRRFESRVKGHGSSSSQGRRATDGGDEFGDGEDGGPDEDARQHLLAHALWTKRRLIDFDRKAL